MTTVRELITFLATMPPDLPVCYQVYSEYCLLEIEQVAVRELGAARDDGWVPDKRPKEVGIKYLALPGN